MLQFLRDAELSDWETQYVLGALTIAAPAALVEAIEAAKAHTKAAIL